MSVAFAEQGSARGPWRRWSPAEDAIVRTYFKTESAEAVAARLGSRTAKAARCRAKQLGALRIPPWTKADDNRLQMLWGEVSLRRIGNLLGRSQGACYKRMWQLTGTVVPAASARPWAEARRTGFHITALRRLLDWAGVKPLQSTTLKRRDRRYSCVQYDQDDVDEAIKKWADSEIVNHAAKRLGIRWHILVKAIERSGHQRPRGKATWRLPTEVIDSALAAYQAAPPVPHISRSMKRGVRGRWAGKASDGATSAERQQ